MLSERLLELQTLTDKTPGRRSLFVLYFFWTLSISWLVVKGASEILHKG
jgi:hypothetical protein